MAKKKASETDLALPPADDLREGSKSLLRIAEKMLVRTAGDYTTAGAFLVQVKALRKSIADRFADPKRKAHEAHKAITALEKELNGVPSQAEEIVAGKMDAWRREQDRLREVEEAKRYETERIKREAEERAKRDAEVARLKAEGDKAGAKELAKEPIMVEPFALRPLPPPDVPKVEGLSVRTTWSARVVDVSLIPPMYLLPNMVTLNGLARTLKEKFSVPGVVAEEKESTVGK